MGTVNSGERHYYNQHKLTQWIPRKEQLLSKLTAARWRLTRLWRTRISSSTTSRPTGVLPADSSLPCLVTSTGRWRMTWRSCSSPATGRRGHDLLHEGVPRRLVCCGAQLGSRQRTEAEVRSSGHPHAGGGEEGRYRGHQGRDLTWLESSPSKLSRDGRPEGPLFIICHHTNQHYCKSFYHHFACIGNFIKRINVLLKKK